MKKKQHKSHNSTITGNVEKDMTQFKREWRNLLKFTDENRLLFAAFVVVMLALVVVVSLYVINHPPDSKSPNQTVTTQANRYFTSNQTAHNDVLTVQISNAKEDDTKDPAFAIDTQETMLILDITITNNSNETQHLIPVNQFYVRSDEGDYAALHISSLVTKQLEATDLEPGQSASGQLSFNIPKRVHNPLLYVDTGWDKYAPIVYEVLN